MMLDLLAGLERDPKSRGSDMTYVEDVFAYLGRSFAKATL